jgi:hypothetical protein
MGTVQPAEMLMRAVDGSGVTHSSSALEGVSTSTIGAISGFDICNTLFWDFHSSPIVTTT